jgi:hypothetical protein
LSREVNQTRFRWTYILLPVAVIAVSCGLAAIFFPRLPEQLAYHFSGGAPDRWLGRGAFVLWTVVPQALLVLAAFVVVGAALAAARYWSVESPALKKLLPVLGNMVALPQLIILFTMLDVFLYNSYQVKLIPVWAFALIVMGLGGAALGVVLVRAARQARRLYANSGRE